MTYYYYFGNFSVLQGEWENKNTQLLQWGICRVSNLILIYELLFRLCKVNTVIFTSNRVWLPIMAMSKLHQPGITICGVDSVNILKDGGDRVDQERWIQKRRNSVKIRGQRGEESQKQDQLFSFCHICEFLIGSTWNTWRGPADSQGFLITDEIIWSILACAMSEQNIPNTDTVK